jgi:sulfoxide reductase heme-binding subunit YedZ
MQKLKAHWPSILTHVAALLPLVLLVWGYTQNQLTANPIRELTLRTGKYALILLLLSLACTPIHIVSGLDQVRRLRRPLGLYAFLYAALHGLIFVGLDYGFNFTLIVQEVIEKRFVQVGILAFLILLSLAATSTKGWTRRLGKNWKRLNRLVYLAALLVVVHFVWIAKGNIREPLLYGGVAMLLLIIRIPGVRNALGKLRASSARHSDA